MVTINKLYKVQIDCSTYEPKIDSIDTVVTIKLLDFNNQPVTNTSVTITVDKGKFMTPDIITDQEATIITNDTTIISVNNLLSSQHVHIRETQIISGTPQDINIDLAGASFLFDSATNRYTCDTGITMNDAKVVKIDAAVDEYWSNNIYHRHLYTGINDVENIPTSQTITRNTDDNGCINLRYIASDWGFGKITANNNSVSLFITGFRKVPLVQGTNYKKLNTSYSDDPFKNYKVLWYDDSIGIAKIKLQYYANFKNGSNASTFSGSSAEAVAQLIFNSQASTDSTVNPSLTTSSSSNLKGDLIPYLAIRRHWYRPDFVIYLNSTGSIYFRTTTNNGEPANGVWVPLEWRYGTENVVSG